MEMVARALGMPSLPGRPAVPGIPCCPAAPGPPPSPAMPAELHCPGAPLGAWPGAGGVGGVATGAPVVPRMLKSPLYPAGGAPMRVSEEQLKCSGVDRATMQPPSSSSMPLGRSITFMLPSGVETSHTEFTCMGRLLAQAAWLLARPAGHLPAGPAVGVWVVTWAVIGSAWVVTWAVIGSAWASCA